LRADARTLSGAKGGCKNHYEFVLSAGAKVEDPPIGGDEIPPWRGKKCDNLSRDLGKQLTHIVRVSFSCFKVLVTNQVLKLKEFNLHPQAE